VTLRKNGANTALGCAISGGASSCADTADAVDFTTADQVNLRVVNSSSSQAPSCRAMVTLTAGGSNLPHDNVVTLHTASETPANGQFCGMNIASGSTATTCASASADDVSIIMPDAGILTGLAVYLNSNVSNGRSETYTVRNLTTGVDTNLTVTISGGTLTNSTMACTTNCAFAPGNRLAIRFNAVGTVGSKTRSLALSYTGAGTALASRRVHFNAGTNYGGYHLGIDATAPGGAAVIMDRPAQLQHLYVHSTTAAASAFTVRVCAGSSSPANCAVGPRCTVPLGGLTCSDTSTIVPVAQGDYVEVQVGNQGDTSGTVGFSVDVVDHTGP
jgi:hypothetical protein